MISSRQRLGTWMGAAIIAVLASAPQLAEAKRSGFSAPSRPAVTRNAPPPKPQVINRTTNNTTVIRETRVVNAPSSSGPGIGSTILGTAAGSAIGTTAGVVIGNAISKPSEPAPAAPQHIPPCDVRYYNCEPKAK